MRLICPSCGAAHSAEAWANDAEARRCIGIVAEMPNMVSRYVMQYLAMFRADTGKGLRWAKARRLLEDLGVFIKDSHISWDKKPPRPNSAKAWGLAMERLLERPPKRLPLESHGYLRCLAYEIADEMDRANESRYHEACRSGVSPVRDSPQPPSMRGDQGGSGPVRMKEALAGRQPLPEDVRAAIKRFTGDAGG